MAECRRGVFFSLIITIFSFVDTKNKQRNFFIQEFDGTEDLSIQTPTFTLIDSGCIMYFFLFKFFRFNSSKKINKKRRRRRYKRNLFYAFQNLIKARVFLFVWNIMHPDFFAMTNGTLCRFKYPRFKFSFQGERLPNLLRTPIDKSFLRFYKIHLKREWIIETRKSWLAKQDSLVISRVSMNHNVSDKRLNSYIVFALR